MHPLPPLREVLQNHSLIAKKHFGQNFLLDLNLTRKIALTSGKLSGETVLEIGPGPGGLTRAILDENVEKLYVVEMDRDFIPALEEIRAFYNNKLEIINGDALKLDLKNIVPKGTKVIANLPYNVGTQILFNFFNHITHYKSFTLMFQKEVAERICAKPRTKDYGRVSVMAQFLCYCSMEFDVDKRNFTPPPKITSTIVNLVPKNLEGLLQYQPVIEKICKLAFGNRRKLLKSNLASLIPNITEMFEEMGINPLARAEELTVEEYTELAKRILP